MIQDLWNVGNGGGKKQDQNYKKGNVLFSFLYVAWGEATLVSLVLWGIDLNLSKFDWVHIIWIHLSIGLNKSCDLSVQKEAMHEPRHDQNPLLYNSLDSYHGTRGCCQVKSVMDPLPRGAQHHVLWDSIGFIVRQPQVNIATMWVKSAGQGACSISVCSPAVFLHCDTSPVPFYKFSFILGGLKKLLLLQPFQNSRNMKASKSGFYLTNKTQILQVAMCAFSSESVNNPIRISEGYWKILLFF